MNEPGIDAEQDPIHAVAADWLLRLQQPDLSLEDTLKWQQWMAQDPRHAQAFHALEEVWNRLDSLPTPPRVAPEALRADSYDGSVSVSAWRAQRAPVSWSHQRRWALAAMLLLTLTCIAIGSVVAPPMLANLPQGRTFECYLSGCL
jgi:ferric-dicitrate binding protein FerR (iron transport regulator)